jgi:hypothetical protein
MIRWTIVRRFTLGALFAAFTACSEPTAPPPSPRPLTLFPIDLSRPGLIECPTDISQTASAFLTSLGGEVSIAGHRIIVPEGALPLGGLFRVTLRVPASKYVEVETRVNGLPHFTFLVPVTVVIDYSRCTRTDIDRAPLRVWYIDPLTNLFLRDMGGVDDKVARTVTFSTGHFSGYAIAQ